MVFSNWCHRKAKYLGRNWVTFIDNFVPCSFTSWKIAFCFSSSSPSLPACFLFISGMIFDQKFLLRSQGSFMPFHRPWDHVSLAAYSASSGTGCFRAASLLFHIIFEGKQRGNFPLSTLLMLFTETEFMNLFINSCLSTLLPAHGFSFVEEKK